MSIRTLVPSYLQSYTNNMETASVSGGTVGECLNDLIRQFPDIEKMLYDKSGELLDYVTLFVNEEDTYPDNLAKPVKDGDVLQLAYLIAGG